MEFRILGTMEVLHAGASVSPGGPRHRALLAVLLVHAGEVVTAARLIQALWGDRPPRTASAMLHVRVAELRRALRDGRTEPGSQLLTRGSGYLLQVGRDELDARRFEELAAAGRQALIRGDHQDAKVALCGALALWRGPALADVADEPFARTEIARLDALRLQALEDRLESELALGADGNAIAELEALVADHPLRERFWCQLMLALYGAGRQGEALSAYQLVRELLVERLGIEPGVELQRLHAAILRQDPAVAVGRANSISVDVPPNNLPAPFTSFVGRHRELTEVRAVLETGRLVTITGAGGVGKSRLALEAARAWLSDHPDGIWLVEMAELTQPDLVAHAVAATLGVREHPRRSSIELLCERMRTTRALLVLDNCEHLVEEVAEFVQRLLGACARLRILVTSRERLGIIGEVLQPLSGLTVPNADAITTNIVEHADAARLFAARASAVLPDFRLTDAITVAAVAQICRRLDGLPLAIEFAAARVNALGVGQIATRLDDRFRLLAQGSRTALPRHQTLQAVVEWSYDLLSVRERLLFDRLSVFVGGFTLEAAEAVCADTGVDDDLSPATHEAVVELLPRLVDKSLVTIEIAGVEVGRYRMLETLRAYGLQRTGEQGGAVAVRDRHGAFFLSFAGPAGAAVRGEKQPAWVDRLETEHGNLSAALGWALDRGEAATAVALAGALYPFWDLRGHYTEGRSWLTRALAATGAVPLAARVRALLGLATLAVIQGDLSEATAACEQALEFCKRVEDRAVFAHALHHLGFGALHRGDLDLASALLEESLRSARAADHRWMEGWSLVFLAIAAVGRTRYDRAARLAAESESLLRTVDDPEGLAWALSIRATALWLGGDRLAAAGPLRESMCVFDDLGARWGLSLDLLIIGLVAGARGQHERATALLAASEALRKSIGAALLPFVKVWLDAAVTATRTAVGGDAFERAWQSGQALSLGDAVAEALRELDIEDGLRS